MVMEPARRFALLDVRNLYDTVEEAIEAARKMPGFDEHCIACIMLTEGFAPAPIGWQVPSAPKEEA